MITEWDMYCITRYDDIKTFVLTSSLIAVFFSWTAIIAYLAFNMDSCCSDKERLLNKKVIKFLKLPCILSLTFVFIGCLIPTTKEMCVIKAVPIITNSEQVQALPKNALKIVNKWMEELMTNGKEVE